MVPESYAWDHLEHQNHQEEAEKCGPKSVGCDPLVGPAMLSQGLRIS